MGLDLRETPSERENLEDAEQLPRSDDAIGSCPLMDNATIETMDQVVVDGTTIIMDLVTMDHFAIGNVNLDGAFMNSLRLAGDVPDEQKPKDKPTIFIAASFLSVFVHATLLIGAIFFAGDALINEEKQPRISITIAKPAKSEVTDEQAVVESNPVLLNSQPISQPISQPPVSQPTISQPNISQQITNEVPSKVEDESSAPEEISNALDAKKLIVPQTKIPTNLPKNEDVQSFSLSPESIMPDVNKFYNKEDVPATPGSGIVFSPTFRKQLQDAQRFNRKRAPTIEELNNGWSHHTGEVVSAGDKCFIKKKVLITESEIVYYRTACLGKTTTSDSMAESIREAMKRIKNPQN